MNFQLSDQQVVESFHSLLKISLAQAKAEHLLDSDILSSAEADLMVCGPALCMYFAALRSNTTPPSVPLPKIDRSQPPTILSATNCPSSFVTMLRMWSTLVPRIQGLTSDHQHDLARVICGLTPVSQPVNPDLNKIAAELRSIAIEISQRRSFQERYAADLQIAIDDGEPRNPGGPSKITASFRPPPSYDEASNGSGTPSPRSSPIHQDTSLPTVPGANLPPQSTGHLSAMDALHPGESHAQERFQPAQASNSASIQAISLLEAIRETLYAALADVIAESPSIRNLLKSDPPRAYFASVALAIIYVAQWNTQPPNIVRGVMGKDITLEECPAEYKPLMKELIAVGEQINRMVEEDEEQAIRLVSRGRTVPEPRIDRIKKMIQRGVGYEDDLNERTPETEEGRRSLEGRSVQFSNRINFLALNLSKLKTFQQRQDTVFEVLSGSF